MIVFLFFEKANFRTVEPCMRSLIDAGERVLFVKPFDYKEHTGGIAPFEVPPGIPHEDIVSPLIAGASRSAREERNGRRPLTGCFLLDAFHRREYVPFLEELSDRVSLATERLLGDLRPKLAVLPEDTDYMKGRLAASVCRRLGIPTVAVLPVYYNIQLRYPALGERLAGDYLVMNGRTRGRMIAAGAPAERVHVTGHPAFDAAPRRAPEPAGPSCLYLMQDLPWETRIVADLIEIFRGAPERSLILKPHPERPAAPVGSLPPNVSVDPGTEIDSLIAGASCVAAQTSQGLHRALHAGRPIVPVNYGPFPLEIDLPEEIPVAREPDGLFRCLERAWERGLDLPEEVLHEHLSPPGAAGRIFERIAGL